MIKFTNLKIGYCKFNEKCKLKIVNYYRGYSQICLLKESIEALDLKNGDIVVDATLGGGGTLQRNFKDNRFQWNFNRN